MFSVGGRANTPTQKLAENGVTTPHPGLSGDGDLWSDLYDWHEPAGVVQVERLEELQREFSATLSGGSEIPAVDTEASGEASFALDEAGEELTYEVTVSDIETWSRPTSTVGLSTRTAPSA